MNKFLVLFLCAISSVSAIDLKEAMPKDINEALHALQYLRAENEQAAEAIDALRIKQSEAFTDYSLSKMIDVILQYSIYLIERIKFYEDHYQTFLKTGKYEEDESFALIDPITIK